MVKQLNKFPFEIYKAAVESKYFLDADSISSKLVT